MSDTLTISGLTKEDLSYLRRADDVYCVNRDGQNFVGAVKRAPYGDAFASDKRVEIPVGGNGGDGYFATAWQFPWASLRAGDVVSFYWYPDAGTNQNARECGLHVDYLHLDVTRGAKTTRYIGAVSVCPDNSARMCKGA